MEKISSACIAKEDFKSLYNSSTAKSIFFSTVYVNVSLLYLNYTHTIQILVKMLVTIITQITYVKVREYTIVDENTQKINYCGVN